MTKVSLFCDDKEIRPGNTVYNSSNSFYFIPLYSDTPIVIKFKNVKSSYSCNAIINIFHYLIEIKDTSYKCNVSPNRIVVNNITDIDLNKTYDMTTKQNVFFIAEFNKPTQNEDLIYRYSNIYFGCTAYFFSQKQISCKLPIDFDLFQPTEFKYEYNIYSKLSCLNDIYVGSIIFKDPYVIEIFEADNLTEISQNIDKNYDPSQKIEKFSIDMINYFYWFTCFGYCDDYYIESGECCKEQILDEWELVSHKEYIWTLDKYLNMLDISIPVIHSMKQNILMDLTLDITKEIVEELFKVYFYNFSILKSSKYKKYVFAFPGTTTNLLLLSEIYLSNQINFERETDIKVHKLFYYIFEEIKKDIFSEEILKDINANKDYQIIFTGHSLGGAMSTLASYYFAKKKLAENELILITFGQPRVGNENFARDYMSMISNVYRIERYQDLVAIVPPVKKIEEWKSVKTVKRIMEVISFIIDFLSIVAAILPENLVAVVIAKKVLAVLEKIKDVYDVIVYALKKLIPEQLILNYPSGYCHIGGLYVLNEESNKFYHCKDFYNEDIRSPYCKNWGINILNLHKIPKFLNNHHYLTLQQRPMERCQESKNIRMFR